MIRRILLASAGALALSGAAFAADLPLRAPPPVYLPPPPLWTGFYLGMNAGYEWGASNTTNTVTADLFGNPLLGNGPAYGVASAALATFSLAPKNSGFIGGGQIGYNYQFANSWVVGLEADFDGIANDNSTTSRFATAKVAGGPAEFLTETVTDSRRLNYLGTVRGRIGYLLTPTLLIYGDGGLAYGGVQSSTGIVQAITAAPFVPSPWGAFGGISSTRIGWTAGGGAEWMFLPNWSAKVEYLYYDLGSVTYGLSPLRSVNFAGTPFTTGASVSRTHFNGNIVRVGLNYHFNWGAPPVVARY
jgi:outer membrane immunogenic protein